MAELLTAAQMRALEKAAIDSGDVTGLELMERAGRGVVEAIFEEWPELAKTSLKKKQRAVVLCGPGNNGGDGFVIARRLHDKGWEVEVFLYGDPDKLPPDARKMYKIWREMGEVLPLGTDRAGQGEKPTLLIDAMFGTGLARPIPIECARAFQAVKKRPVSRAAHPWHVPFNVVAVDCPSGFDIDRGDYLMPRDLDLETEDIRAFATHMEREVYPRFLHCDLCVTFHRAKIGHYLTEVGFKSRPKVINIGLPDGHNETDVAVTLGRDLGRDDDQSTVRLLCPPADHSASSLKVWLKHYALNRHGAHKYEHGHALVLGGGPGKGGAARMAARAALRIGAGLVTMGVPHAALTENAAQLNAVMLTEIDDETALSACLEDARLSALCLGPGLGVGASTRALVRAALAASALPDGPEKRRVVLDADALTSFERAPEELFSQLHENCVLTPHEGEFARLFPEWAESIRDTSSPPISKAEAASRAAERAGCTILLKGPATVIASPGGMTSIHAALYDRRTPWLGTAGAGDVLAGMITGLLADGMASFYIHQIVEIAAYLHVECARSFGPGLIAEDLPEELPKVLRAHGL